MRPRKVLGDEYVNRALGNADDFSRPSRMFSMNIAGVPPGPTAASTSSSAALSTLECSRPSIACKSSGYMSEAKRPPGRGLLLDGTNVPPSHRDLLPVE